MNIGEICTREVVMADQASTLQQAATLMRERHVGTLLVTGTSGEGMHVVGVVTDRDVVIEAVARGLDVKSVRIGIERETAERGKLPSAPPPPRPIHIPAYSFT